MCASGVGARWSRSICGDSRTWSLSPRLGHRPPRSTDRSRSFRRTPYNTHGTMPHRSALGSVTRTDTMRSRGGSIDRGCTHGHCDRRRGALVFARSCIAAMEVRDLPCSRPRASTLACSRSHRHAVDGVRTLSTAPILCSSKLELERHSSHVNSVRDPLLRWPIVTTVHDRWTWLRRVAIHMARRAVSARSRRQRPTKTTRSFFR
jgi:hypothetical protein